MMKVLRCASSAFWGPVPVEGYQNVSKLSRRHHHQHFDLVHGRSSNSLEVHPTNTSSIFIRAGIDDLWKDMKDWHTDHVVLPELEES